VLVVLGGEGQEFGGLVGGLGGGNGGDKAESEVLHLFMVMSLFNNYSTLNKTIENTQSNYKHQIKVLCFNSNLFLRNN